MIQPENNQLPNSTIEGSLHLHKYLQSKRQTELKNRVTKLGAPPKGTKSTVKSKIGLTGTSKEMSIHKKYHKINVHMALLSGVYDNRNSYLTLKQSNV